MQVLNWIKSLFKAPSYQDELERYISSKHPTTAADVEYWIRSFELHKEWVL